MLFPKPLGNTAIESFLSNTFCHTNHMEDDIKHILQDKQFHLQLKSEQKEIIQNVLERKDSMAVLPRGFGKSMCYIPPS
jgi:superfamily II DNA helicase RecQ